MLGLKKTHHCDVTIVQNQQLSIHNERNQRSIIEIFYLNGHCNRNVLKPFCIYSFGSLSRDLCIWCLQDGQFVFPAKQTHDLGVASTVHYQMIYWTSFCILFPFVDFALESHPVVSVRDEISVDMAICKILQDIFAKFPKYASVMLRYF